MYHLYLVYHVRIINIPFDIPLGSKFMDPGKFAEFAIFLGYSGKNFLNPRPGLDSRSFPQNLES
jgi:hypothetical protein